MWGRIRKRYRNEAAMKHTLGYPGMEHNGKERQERLHYIFCTIHVCNRGSFFPCFFPPCSVARQPISCFSHKPYFHTFIVPFLSYFTLIFTQNFYLYQKVWQYFIGISQVKNGHLYLWYGSSSEKNMAQSEPKHLQTKAFAVLLLKLSQEFCYPRPLRR